MIGSINTVVSAQLLIASATSLTTATAKNILGSSTTTFLNPGQWLAYGMVGFVANTGTTVTLLAGGFNTVTGTLPTGDFGLTQLSVTSFTTASTSQINLFPQLFTVGNNGVTLFLVASATFATSTMTAYGQCNLVQVQD